MQLTLVQRDPHDQPRELPIVARAKQLLIAYAYSAKAMIPS